MEERTGKSKVVELREAASLLDLSADAVRSLTSAGYLAPADHDDEPRYALGDLKAFVARNADDGSGILWDDDGDAVDPLALLNALDVRSDDMARRAYAAFCVAYPEASGWTPGEQGRFIEQARKRFEAILAVTSQGQEVGESLVGDLEEVGASAAWAGSSLPQLLVIMRISRDLVVQTAVEVAEERGRHWGLALSLLLNRVLPAMDCLTDSVAQGYWAAVLSHQQESKARYQAVVEDSSDGIFEIDLDGRIQYVNRSFAVITGRTPDELDQAPLFQVLVPVEQTEVLQRLMTSSPQGSQRLELVVERADGVRRVVEVSTQPRHEHDEVVGLQGVVRDITAAHDLEVAKNEFLALITNELRNPLTAILGLGVVRDVDDLLGEQPDVQGVQDCAHRRDGEVGLEVLLVVPHEGADACVALHPQRRQGVRQPM
jgi:PAS domain S-box-containing protein